MKYLGKIIGSHDSITGMPLKHKWQFPALLFARCQNKTLIEQLKEGVTFFDIRFRMNEKSEWEFAHGLIVFKYTMNEFRTFLKYINDAILIDKSIIIRIIYESKSKFETGDAIFNKFFSALCSNFEDEYPRIKFIGGNRKRDWKQLYTFKDDNLQYEQWCSSMKGKIPIPWLYMALNRKKIYTYDIPNNNLKYHLIDFI